MVRSVLTEEMVIENALKRVRNLIFAYYILLLIEGALRKWVLPQLSGPIYFVKDPILIWMYVEALKYGFFPKNKLIQFTLYLTYFLFVYTFIQIVIGNANVLVSIIGLRNYLLYIPLSFLIYNLFGKEELIKLARWTLYIGIPMAILIAIQFNSSRDAFINRNVGVNSGVGFGFVDNLVRPYGTFSFVGGMIYFVPTVLIFLLMHFTLPQKYKLISGLISIVVFLSIMTCIAMGGSRSIIMICLLVLSFFLAGNILLFKQRESWRIFLYLIFGAFIVYGLFLTVFSFQLSKLEKRFDVAEASEGSMTDRIFSSIDFISIMYTSGDEVLGYGIGYGSGGGVSLATGNRGYTLGEGEWSRVMGEMGIVVGAFILFFRFGVALYMFYAAIMAVLKGNSPLPLIMAGYIAPTLITGLLTSNGIVLGFGWFYIGVSFALTKVYSQNEFSEEAKHED
ncbi:MAG TPA: hypothetical protein VK796_12915 [Cytophaga sp.]|nr:hypothetical protein [Cytophaga sp.]